jgi:hypothetical protein
MRVISMTNFKMIRGEADQGKLGFARLISGVILIASFMLPGCARYRAPITPEELAPAMVENLTVTTDAKGVLLTWVASDKDRRGKELKSVEGYSIERKELIRRGDETDPEVRFEKLGFVKDAHVEVRDQLRKEARAAGKIGRSVKVPEEQMKFSFSDTSPELGKTYVYQVVPQNQGGTEGQVGQLIKIVFQGAQSAVVTTVSDEIANQQALATQPAQ